MHSPAFELYDPSLLTWICDEVTLNCSCCSMILVSPVYLIHGRNQCSLWPSSAESHQPVTICSPENINGGREAPLCSSSASQGSLGAMGTPWKLDLPLWWVNTEWNMAENYVSTCLLTLRARAAWEHWELTNIPASSSTLSVSRFAVHPSWSAEELITVGAGRHFQLLINQGICVTW